jgi:NAD(P)H-dependent flavin oxidoreductase YrpB (nitropropane dioxygenase family)
VTDGLGIDHPVLSAGIPIMNVDLVAAVSNAGALGVVHMVTTAEQGAAAARAGVAVIVAQGHEAGGGLVGSVGGW